MADAPIHRDAVLGLLRSRAPRAVHVGEICKQLKISIQDRDRVLDFVDELVLLGFAREMPGRRYRATRETRPPRTQLPPSILEGYYVGHPRGFGFVTAEDGRPDIFVAPPNRGAALHGDRVRVDARPSLRGREGSVVGIVQRRSPRVGGLLHRTGGNTWIEPDDSRLPGPMPVDGELPSGARPGLQVVARIVQYPKTPYETPVVEVLDGLGARGTTAVEVAKLKLRDGIVEEFPEDALDEARALPNQVRDEDREGREDLRDLPLVTIDPEDARDHDDAVWAERRAGGGFRVLVAIADVSHYVAQGSALDREAISRGVSIYLPDRAIPMLPPRLSSGIASLVPGKDRLTLAAEIELSESGAVTARRYIEGVMRSHARLTYASVARILGLANERPEDPTAAAHEPLLRTLFDAAALLHRRRLKRGALDFDLPEAKVVLDDANEPHDVERARKDPAVRKAYNLVEELMLLANEVVAEDMAKERVATIYRVHAPPDSDRMDIFAELATSLGHRLEPGTATHPKKLAQFLRSIEGDPHEQALNFLLLRSMQQATYDVHNIGHFGLAAKHYLHFTSPIRRYPDLVVHRLLRRVIHKNNLSRPPALSSLQSVAVESSRLERRSMELERDVVDLYRVVLMRGRIGEEFAGSITGMASHGFYVSFDSPYVDALVPIETLEDDDYELDELGLRFVGRRSGYAYGLGDRVRVTLEEALVESRKLVVRVAGHTRTAEASRLSKKPRASRKPPEPGTARSRPQGQDDVPGAALGGRKTALRRPPLRRPPSDAPPPPTPARAGGARKRRRGRKRR